MQSSKCNKVKRTFTFPVSLKLKVKTNVHGMQSGDSVTDHAWPVDLKYDLNTGLLEHRTEVHDLKSEKSDSLYIQDSTVGARNRTHSNFEWLNGIPTANSLVFKWYSKNKPFKN